MKRWLPVLLVLLWTNPGDADLAGVRFFIHVIGRPDTLRSELYSIRQESTDPDSAWTRSAPGISDSARFAIPPGAFTWETWCRAYDWTGNESLISNVITIDGAAASLAQNREALRVYIRASSRPQAARERTKGAKKWRAK